MLTLRGITWDHPRGYGSVQAAADAYHAEQPDVKIEWEARTLQEFADFPIDQLTDDYDLLIIDHPFVGFAAATHCLVPLDSYISADDLAVLAEQSVGRSHESYYYDGHQWALAIDAAAQVSAYRPDLLERAGMGVPRTWEDVLTLGRTLRERDLGSIAIPSIPIDALMSFCTLCANAGEDPFDPESDEIASRDMARYALELLRDLVSVSHPESLDWNPIRTLDRMSGSDEVVYCPLLFGYSNYARPGFAPNVVCFTNIPSAGERGSAGAILGGTGIAVSPSCDHPEVAGAFAHWICSADVQRGIYVEAGGQPGNRIAWTDPAVNAACHNYFADTLQTLENAYLRPRYDGFIDFQDEAGVFVHEFLRVGGETDALIDTLNQLYRETQSLNLTEKRS